VFDIKVWIAISNITLSVTLWLGFRPHGQSTSILIGRFGYKSLPSIGEASPILSSIQILPLSYMSLSFHGEHPYQSILRCGLLLNPYQSFLMCGLLFLLAKPEDGNIDCH
jgi:hypothetical protein